MSDPIFRSSHMGNPPFVIQTQGLENYGGPRAGDPNDPDNHCYWKIKGGETYIIRGLDRMQDAIAWVQFHKCMVNDGWIEHVCGGCTLDEWMAKFDNCNDNLAHELSRTISIHIHDIHEWFNPSHSAQEYRIVERDSEHKVTEKGGTNG